MSYFVDWGLKFKGKYVPGVVNKSIRSAGREGNGLCDKVEHAFPIFQTFEGFQTFKIHCACLKKLVWILKEEALSIPNW